jgi:hypothetical protein
LTVGVIAKIEKESNVSLADMQSVIGIEVRLVSHARYRRRWALKNFNFANRPVASAAEESKSIRNSSSPPPFEAE